MFTMEDNNKPRNVQDCCYMSTGNCTEGCNWHHSEEPAQRKILGILVGKRNEVEVYWNGIMDKLMQEHVSLYFCLSFDSCCALQWCFWEHKQL